MGIKQNELWEDVFDRRLDEHLAPALYEVTLQKAPKIYTNPKEFFQRTHLSPSMQNILKEIIKALRGKGGRNVYPLFSLYGGGKTHTLITIYHTIKNPKTIADTDKELATQLTELTPKIRTIILDCDSPELVPDPSTPLDAKAYKVKTIWGAIAHQLGRYDTLRTRDQTGVAPTPEEIKNLLGNEPTIILIDEIVKRIHTLTRALDPSLKDYGENMTTFVENLARAVIGTKTVVLITLPIDVKIVKDEKTGVERESYDYEEAFKEGATKVHRSLGRVVRKIDVPLTVGDVIEVLKKRTFKQIAAREAAETQRKCISTYSENPEIFGKLAIREARKIADHYPYHPTYVAILYEIVTRSPELQKTRDALRITREVTRSLWKNKKENPELIMPWHLDLSNPNIRNKLITTTYRTYDAALNKDIVTEAGDLGRVELTSKPQLAYRMATAIFLKTFTYAEILVAAKPFPTKTEVASMTYEKTLFEEQEYKVTDIYDILEEMDSTLIHFQLRDERAWFTPFPSIIETIERRAKDIPNREAYKELKGLTNKILVADIDIVAGARRRIRRREELKPKVYTEKTSIIIRPDEQPILRGIQNYTLLVLLKKPTEEELYELIYTEDGRTRTYRNTITLLYPSDENLIDRLLTEVKKYIAASKITGELDEIYPDETIREIQKKKADTYIRTRYGEILRRALSALDTVAYPKYDAEKKTDAIASTKVSPSRSIISQVELTLQDRSIAKIPPDYKMTFDGLNFLLRDKLGTNLKEGDREIGISDLLGYFNTNPKLPIVTLDMLRPTLREGVANLHIAIRSVRENKLYWKKLHTEKPIGGIETGDEPTFIDREDTIIPWKLAAKEFAESLLKKEGIFEEEGIKKRIWYTLLIEGTERRLSDIIKQPEFEDILRNYPIIEHLETIREEFDIILSQEYMRTKINEPIEIDVKVEQIGVFDYEVELRVDDGTIEPKKGKPSFSSKWKLKAPEIPKTYAITLNALANDPKRTKIPKTLTIEVLREVEFEEVHQLTTEHIGRTLVQINTSDYNSFTNLMYTIEPMLKELEPNLDGNVTIASGVCKINLNVSNTDPAVFKHLIKEAIDTTEGKVEAFNATLDIEKGLTINEVLVAACQDLKNIKYSLLK
jgi:hypothetical protein